MKISNERGELHCMRAGKLALGAVAGILLAGAAWAAQSEDTFQTDDETSIPPEPHMPESLRSAINKLVVIAGEPPSASVTGSYDKETAGLLGGMEQGSRIGTISREIGGVPVNIPIPVLGTLGAIYGGISGAAKREIQEFRDKLTETLLQQDSPPLRSDGLALDAFWAIRKRPGIESSLFAPTVEIPADTDAVLYISLDELTIDVQGKEAIITATARGSLRLVSDNRTVYQTSVQYQDRDTLSNWIDNDSALWRDYTNFARYYLGREIAADVINRVDIVHTLQPAESKDVKKDRKNEHKFVTKSHAPTLAWTLDMPGGGGGGPWSGAIDEANIYYDLEIFDNRQPVYEEAQIPDPSHTLGFELENCGSYRWSVRPSYHVNGEVRFGEWMRYVTPDDSKTPAKKGLVGRQASEAPAYTQDFAVLEIECSRR